MNIHELARARTYIYMHDIQCVHDTRPRNACMQITSTEEVSQFGHWPLIPLQTKKTEMAVVSQKKDEQPEEKCDDEEKTAHVSQTQHSQKVGEQGRGNGIRCTLFAAAVCVV